jgi:hypothetical protein
VKVSTEVRGSDFDSRIGGKIMRRIRHWDDESIFREGGDCILDNKGVEISREEFRSRGVN